MRAHVPLPGWEAPGLHSRAGVGEELAEGWEISVQVDCGERKDLQTGDRQRRKRLLHG